MNVSYFHTLPTVELAVSALKICPESRQSQDNMYFIDFMGNLFLALTSSLFAYGLVSCSFFCDHFFLFSLLIGLIPLFLPLLTPIPDLVVELPFWIALFHYHLLFYTSVESLSIPDTYKSSIVQFVDIYLDP